MSTGGESVQVASKLQRVRTGATKQDFELSVVDSIKLQVDPGVQVLLCRVQSTHCSTGERRYHHRRRQALIHSQRYCPRAAASHVRRPQSAGAIAQPPGKIGAPLL